jgi:hypothetical protein
MTARVAAITVALALAGCVSWQPDHSAKATLFHVLPSSGNDVVMWVVDETGLVAAVREAARVQPGALDASAEARPDVKEIDVRWFGGVCHHGPTVTLTGSSGALHVTVQPDVGPGPLFGMCPGAGVDYGVTLTLSEAVAQDAIELDTVR